MQHTPTLSDPQAYQTYTADKKTNNLGTSTLSFKNPPQKKSIKKKSYFHLACSTIYPSGLFSLQCFLQYNGTRLHLSSGAQTANKIHLKQQCLFPETMS